MAEARLNHVHELMTELKSSFPPEKYFVDKNVEIKVLNKNSIGFVAKDDIDARRHLVVVPEEASITPSNMYTSSTWIPQFLKTCVLECVDKFRKVSKKLEKPYDPLPNPIRSCTGVVVCHVRVVVCRSSFMFLSLKYLKFLHGSKRLTFWLLLQWSYSWRDSSDYVCSAAMRKNIRRRGIFGLQTTKAAETDCKDVAKPR
eukprot:m.25991 g.25991  ORF g.25991 m.25991 type:complete len:200 (-) comp7756_c0_seq2:1597-2196(-)